MKNLFLFIITFLFIIISCSEKDSKENNTTRSTSLKQVSDWYYLGDIHNEYLMEACLNFDTKQLTSKEKGLSYLKTFLTSFTPTDNRFGKDLNNAFKDATKDWTFFVEDTLKAHALSEDVTNALVFGIENGLIDNFEKSLISDFLNLANENYSFEELNAFIDEKILTWEAQGYSKDEDFGMYSGMVLALSKRSTEWWLENSDCLPSDENRWIWLAWDAAGAAVGVLPPHLLLMKLMEAQHQMAIRQQ